MAGTAGCRLRSATPPADRRPLPGLGACEQDGIGPELYDRSAARCRGSITPRAGRAEQGIPLCAFHGERGNMKEGAMTAVTFGACRKTSRGRICKAPRAGAGWPEGAAAPWAASGGRRRCSARMPRSAKGQRLLPACVPSANQIITSSGQSGPETAPRALSPTGCLGSANPGRSRTPGTRSPGSRSSTGLASMPSR
jgi:hypothetical protein